MARTAHRSRAMSLYRPRTSHPKPIVIRTTVNKPKKHHARRGGGGGRGLFEGKRMGIMLGGFAVGMIQKSGVTIPELPLLGQAGTIGVAAYFLSSGGRNKLADEVATAALAIAAYELGSTGKIVGGDYVAGF